MSVPRAGRRALPGGRARGGRRAAGAGAADPVAVRVWAKSQGIEVKDWGRVPAGLVVKFKAATAQ
jgi:Lsr2